MNRSDLADLNALSLLPIYRAFEPRHRVSMSRPRRSATRCGSWRNVLGCDDCRPETLLSASRCGGKFGGFASVPWQNLGQKSMNIEILPDGRLTRMS
jgi:hypothetical protein